MRKKDPWPKLMGMLRNFTYDILSQVLPFYSTEDTRYFGFNAAICGRCGAGDVN